jgi:hypothetical protein
MYALARIFPRVCPDAAAEVTASVPGGMMFEGFDAGVRRRSMMTNADDVDMLLARLGAQPATHPALERIDETILARLANDRRREAGAPLRLGLAAAASALAAAAIGGGASMAAAQPRVAPALGVLGSGDGLAPSSLLLEPR